MSKHPSQTVKILIVEDNPVDSKMLKSMLSANKQIKNSIKTTSSLKTALNNLDKFSTDVILLDLDLPDSKGISTLKKIRAKNKNIAIVVNTGAYEDEIGLKTLSLGAQDFLVKGKYNTYIVNKVIQFAIERKRLESELLEANSKLRDTQTQLIQSEKMKVVGGLASGVAHEVKNPLSTILYGVTYLNDHTEHKDENVELVLKNIKEAANRANKIITDLLNFSSIGKIEPEESEINSVLENSLFLLKHQLQRSHIELETELAAKLPLLDIDISRVEQVIINIIFNSMHAMPHGGRITVRTKKSKVTKSLVKRLNLDVANFKTNEKLVIVEIEDTGSGIEKDKLNKIFDPFFTTRRARGGVGLGLSVSRTIMENHKGELALTNKSNCGVIASLIFKV